MLCVMNIYTDLNDFRLPSPMLDAWSSQEMGEIITEIKNVWPECTIVHGRPRHSESQGGIERLNRTVQQKLAAWMLENNSKKWSVGVKIGPLALLLQKLMQLAHLQVLQEQPQMQLALPQAEHAVHEPRLVGALSKCAVQDERRSPCCVASELTYLFLRIFRISSELLRKLDHDTNLERAPPPCLVYNITAPAIHPHIYIGLTRTERAHFNPNLDLLPFVSCGFVVIRLRFRRASYY